MEGGQTTNCLDLILQVTSLQVGMCQISRHQPQYSLEAAGSLECVGITNQVDGHPGATLYLAQGPF